MKRRGAEKVMRNLAGKNAEQQLEYWRKGTKALKSLQGEFGGQDRQ